MKKLLLLSVFFLILLSSVRSQPPVELLGRLSAQSSIEKVYLHFDRDSYIVGQTAWFKAYLYSDYQPDTISSNLYVELLNGTGAIIERLVLPVFFGAASGQFELSDSLSTGVYSIRSYSVSMLNQDSGFIGRQHIFIYGKKNKINEPGPVESTIQLDFFPEGGNLISGVPNTVAFKATKENGFPVLVNGKVMNEKDEVVTTFETYHDGMGLLVFSPVPGVKYYAILDGASPVSKYYLPESADKGIALSVIPHPQGSFFEIKQKNNDPAFTVAYMIGQMQHHVVFRQDFKTSNEEIQGVINTQHLRSGILQITFFNKDDQPLAERLCFVNNKEYILSGSLLADTLSFVERSRNRFSLQLSDTIKGTFSISVSDAAYGHSPFREDNIFTSLLLTSDLKGYVHRPAYYFSDDNDSVKTAVDLLMMTHGWRRFRWTELPKTLMRLNSGSNPAYITLAGKVNLQGTKKPFANRQLLLMITGLNKKRSTHLLQTNSEGRFFLDSLVFYSKNRLLFCDVRGKKSQYIDVLLGSDSLHRPFSLPAGTFMAIKKIRNDQPLWQMDYDAILKAEGIMLEGVTVKAQKKSLLQELEEKYTSGLFSGDANKIIDLVNSKEETSGFRNIFDYLQFRVAGLQIFQDGLDYSIFYRQVATASALGNAPMVLYLDEVETDASFISAIPANQVALVKVFSSFAGALGNAPGGVLAVYTKKGSDDSGTSGFASLSTYNGYSVVKEFYSPDYSIKKQDKKADNRITLDWRPDILVNSIDPVIPFSFYNNDRTKSFRVVIEGMTLDGKMLMIEKIFSGKAF